MPHCPKAGAGKAVGGDAALQVAAERPLHTGRHRPAVVVTVALVGEPGLEVLPDVTIERALAPVRRLVPSGCALLRPARASMPPRSSSVEAQAWPARAGTAVASLMG